MKNISLIVLFITLTSFLNPTRLGYDIGDTVEDFNLKNVDGKMVSLSQFKNTKGFIVIFTCNTCPYSMAYEDRIIDLDKKYKPKGYPVIAINPNNPLISNGDSFELMQKRAKEKGFTFPYLVDQGQQVFPKFGATRTPHVFLLNKENDQLKLKYIGAIDNNSQDASAVTEKYVENAIDGLLSNKKIEPAITKAIGCGIKK